MTSWITSFICECEISNNVIFIIMLESIKWISQVPKWILVCFYFLSFSFATFPWELLLPKKVRYLPVITQVLSILFQFFLTTRKEVSRSHLVAKESLRRWLILIISETILFGIGCLKVSREATRFRLNITNAFTILSLASNKMPSFYWVWPSFWFICRGTYTYYIIIFC